MSDYNNAFFFPRCCYQLIIILCTNKTHKFNKWPFSSFPTTVQQIIPKRKSSLPSTRHPRILESFLSVSSLPSAMWKSLRQDEQVSSFIKVPLKILWIHFKSGKIKPQTRNEKRVKKVWSLLYTSSFKVTDIKDRNRTHGRMWVVERLGN